jgi:hypothetical protein
MLKETRRFEWEAFLAAVTGHYHTRGCEVDMKFTAGGDGFSRFVIEDSASGESRTLDAHDTLQELKEILYPSEAVKVLGVYKPRHAWFGQEYVFIAVEQDDSLTKFRA